MEEGGGGGRERESDRGEKGKTTDDDRERKHSWDMGLFFPVDLLETNVEQ